YRERLRTLRRVALTRSAANQLQVAPVLFDAGTRGGAASLLVEAGELRAGAWADIAAIDLDHISLAGATAANLAATVALSAAPDVVSDVWVGGKRVVEDRQHVSEQAAKQAFERVA